MFFIGKLTEAKLFHRILLSDLGGFFLIYLNGWLLPWE
jgi:hypothetical protein